MRGALSKQTDWVSTWAPAAIVSAWAALERCCTALPTVTMMVLICKQPLHQDQTVAASSASDAAGRSNLLNYAAFSSMLPVWVHYVSFFNPFYTSVRNWMFYNLDLLHSAVSCNLVKQCVSVAGHCFLFVLSSPSVRKCSAHFWW